MEDLVIKSTDKGGMTVLQPREQYLEERFR